MNTVKIRILADPSVSTPEYMTPGSAGVDLRACLPSPDSHLIISPMRTAIVSTGICIELPLGYEAQIRSRSGLSTSGIVVMNSPGTIDSDYRGYIKVVLGNLGSEPFSVSHGMRIAQMVISKYETAQFERVDVVEDTIRGDGGLGSTGLM